VECGRLVNLLLNMGILNFLLFSIEILHCKSGMRFWHNSPSKLAVMEVFYILILIDLSFELFLNYNYYLYEFVLKL
jgi:hypothetical protein